MVTLFAARTTDGNSSSKPWNGGYGTFFVFGTFNGCTVKLQWSPDGTNWADVADASFTAAGQINFEVAGGYVRANVSSAGGSTSITCGYIQRG